MAGSVNKVILVGNLGKDPEVRNTQTGGKLVNLTLATSETWNDRASGERKERTEWHRVVIFNERVADVAERFLKKGAKIYVEGALQTRKWTDQSGQERYTTEVVIAAFNGNLTMLDTRSGGGGGDYGGGDSDSSMGGAGGGASGGASGGGGSSYSRDRAPAARTPAGGGGSRGGQSGGQSGGPSWDAPKGGDLDDEIPF